MAVSSFRFQQFIPMRRSTNYAPLLLSGPLLQSIMSESKTFLYSRTALLPSSQAAFLLCLLTRHGFFPADSRSASLTTSKVYWAFYNQHVSQDCVMRCPKQDSPHSDKDHLLQFHYERQQPSSGRRQRHDAVGQRGRAGAS
jgi:hypothetical protein